MSLRASLSFRVGIRRQDRRTVEEAAEGLAKLERDLLRGVAQKTGEGDDRDEGYDLESDVSLSTTA